jgi:hypothetical protein
MGIGGESERKNRGLSSRRSRENFDRCLAPSDLIIILEVLIGRFLPVRRQSVVDSIGFRSDHL